MVVCCVVGLLDASMDDPQNVGDALMTTAQTRGLSVRFFRYILCFTDISKHWGTLLRSDVAWNREMKNVVRIGSIRLHKDGPRRILDCGTATTLNTGVMASAFFDWLCGHIFRKKQIMFEKICEAPNMLTLGPDRRKIQDAVSAVHRDFTGAYAVLAFMHEKHDPKNVTLYVEKVFGMLSTDTYDTLVNTMVFFDVGQINTREYSVLLKTPPNVGEYVMLKHQSPALSWSILKNMHYALKHIAPGGLSQERIEWFVHCFSECLEDAVHKEGGEEETHEHARFLVMLRLSGLS
jgi:hypothetical protein